MHLRIYYIYIMSELCVNKRLIKHFVNWIISIICVYKIMFILKNQIVVMLFE